MRLVAAPVAALALLLAAGCGATDRPPPQSPLADTSTPTAVAPPTPGTPTAPVPPPDGDTAVDLETAIGLAIEMLAEWLGVPDTQLTVLAAEAVTWPNACIGIAAPGRACAEVLTPGYRVLLLDAFGGAHALHGDARLPGLPRWAGEVAVEAVIVEVDAVSGRLTLDVDGGVLELRTAPGTLWDLGPGRSARGIETLRVGERVYATYDVAPDGEEPAVLAQVAMLAPLDEAGQ